MNKIVLTAKQKWTRIILLIIFTAIICLTLSAFWGYYFSQTPIKEVSRANISYGSEEYDAALSNAKFEQKNIFRNFILAGLVLSSIIALIVILSWDKLYENRKLMSNTYRAVTVLVFSALGFGITYLAHYLVHSFLFESLGWFSYTVNRMRINNIIVFLGLFIVTLCVVLGLIVSYFIVNRFLYPVRDVKSLSYSYKEDANDKSKDKRMMHKP